VETEGTVVGKFKRWLYNKFLPAWCKDDLLEANARLSEQIDAQRREIDRLNAYIRGMESAMRRSARITVYGNEAKRQ